MEILLLASLETEQSVIRKGGVYCTSDVDTNRTGFRKVDLAPSSTPLKIHFYLFLSSIPRRRLAIISSPRPEFKE
jgi:hypothetical protein